MAGESEGSESCSRTGTARSVKVRAVYGCYPVGLQERIELVDPCCLTKAFTHYTPCMESLVPIYYMQHIV